MQIDPLSDVLSLLRPHTYVAGGFDLSGRWSIGFDRHAGVKCYTVVSGAAWLRLDGVAQAVRLEGGDCVLLSDGRPFHLSSDLSLDPVPLKLQPVEWRGGIAMLNGGGETLILGGHFDFTGAHAGVLFAAMPPVAHLRDESARLDMRWALDRMRRELVEMRPGGVLVHQHLAHMLLVEALRLYLSGSAGRHVGLLFGLADPRLAAAIAAIHAEPGAHWTLPALAIRAGMSRSSFAQAFKDAVGTSPIDYLTQWRMLLASDRLAAGRESVSAVAAALGYSSEAAFSTAFRRVMGHPPGRHARTPSPAGPRHPWAAHSACPRSS